jgi:hypothetical protein
MEKVRDTLYFAVEWVVKEDLIASTARPSGRSNIKMKTLDRLQLVVLK